MGKVDYWKERDICLPVIILKKEPLAFRKYKVGDILVPCPFFQKVLEPAPSAEII